MSDWLATLVRRLEREEALVRVVVGAVRGSAPREPGACMLVGRSHVDGTIGGGHLEWKSLEIARGMLEASGDGGPRLDRFVLGATLGQCCGGVVELWFERVCAAEREFFREALAKRGSATPIAIATTWSKGTPVLREVRAAASESPRALLQHSDRDTFLERIDTERTALWLFGAGHVGQAIVRTLAGLPFAVTWVDERGELFPDVLPDNAVALVSDDPAGEVAGAPPDAIYLVLTHRHDLDFDLCRAILVRDDFRWAGVIGSATKAASFRNRLARHGVPAERIARLVSPIGVEGIASKEPAAIAVAVAAQLLQVQSRAASNALPHAAAR
jgi:xanthine dehydrogenase accessory factor